MTVTLADAQRTIVTPLCYFSNEPMAIPVIGHCENHQRYFDYGTLAMWKALHIGCPNCFGADHEFRLIHLDKDDTTIMPRIHTAVQRAFPEHTFEEYKFKTILKQFSQLFQIEKETYSIRRVLGQFFNALFFEMRSHQPLFLASSCRWDVIRYCFREKKENQISLFLDPLIETINEEDFSSLVEIIFESCAEPEKTLVEILLTQKPFVSPFWNAWTMIIKKCIQRGSFSEAKEMINKFKALSLSSRIDAEELLHLEKTLQKAAFCKFQKLIAQGNYRDSYALYKAHNLKHIFELFRNDQLSEYFEGI